MDIKRIVGYCISALVLSLFWFIMVLIGPDTFHNSIGLNLLLAFLTASCAVVIHLDAQNDRNVARPLRHIPFIFLTVIHTWAAAEYLYNARPPSSATPEAVAGDIVKLAIFSMLLVLCFKWEQSDRFQTKIVNWTIGFVLVSLAAALEFLVYYTVLPIMPQNMISRFGLICAVITVSGLFISRRLWIKASTSSDHDCASITSWFILITLSLLPTLFSLVFPSVIWIYSVGVQSTAVFFILLGVQVPLLIEIGVSRKSAITMAFGLFILSLGPFQTTILIEIFSQNMSWINVGMYGLMHSGAAVLSGAMAVLVFIQHQQSQEPYQIPLISVFGSWCIIEVHLVYFALFPYSPSAIPYESIIPLVVGSLVTIMSLAHAARWVWKTPSRKTKAIRNLWVVLGISATTVMIWVGEFVQVQLETGVPAVLDSPLGQIILMIVNLAALYMLIGLWLTHIRKTGGRMTADVLAVTMLAFWIAPSMLRCNYLDWTSGWWASEMMRFFGLLISVPLLGYLFIHALKESQDSFRRARLYTDVLTHDIRNHHQSILLAVEILDMGIIANSTNTTVLESIRTELRRAEALVENALQLGQVDANSEIPLFPVDLVESIEAARRISIAKTSADDLEFNLLNEHDECFVLADELLMQVFSNLFINSIQNSPEKIRLDIDVKMQTEQGKCFWMVGITDCGRGIALEDREHLFSRYMRGATGTGLGLSVVHALVKSYGGQIRVDSRVPEDYTQGTKFTIILQACNEEISV